MNCWASTGLVKIIPDSHMPIKSLVASSHPMVLPSLFTWILIKMVKRISECNIYKDLRDINLKTRNLNFFSTTSLHFNWFVISIFSLLHNSKYIARVFHPVAIYLPLLAKRKLLHEMESKLLTAGVYHVEKCCSRLPATGFF